MRTVATAIAVSLMLLVSSALHAPLSHLLQRFKTRLLWERVGRIYDSFQKYTDNKKTLLKGVVLSLFITTSTMLIAYYLSRALSWSLPFHVFFFAIPMITVLTILPVSFGGIGLRETAFFLVFGTFGISAPGAVAMALLWYSINIISGLFGGVCYMLYPGKPEKDDVP